MRIQRRWIWPTPIDCILHRADKRQGFVGRSWLFEQVRSWADSLVHGVNLMGNNSHESMHPAYVVDIGQAPQEAAEVPGGDAHGIGGQAPMADLAAANRLGSPYHWIIHNLKSAQAGLLHKVPGWGGWHGRKRYAKQAASAGKRTRPIPIAVVLIAATRSAVRPKGLKGPERVNHGPEAY